MTQLPTALYDIATIREIEKFAVDYYQLSISQLMQRAGKAAFETLQSLWPAAKKIVVMSGTGNNGGDGLVLATLAKAQGMDVTVYQVSQINEEKYSKAARQARNDWLNSGEKIIPFDGQALDADVIVDALLGFGAQSPLSDDFSQAIHVMNHSGVEILAIDLPSGLDGDTGCAFDKAVKATATITFVAMKIGLLTHEAIGISGKVFFADLGIERAVVNKHFPSHAHLIHYEKLMAQLPPRSVVAHKGDNGHICVIGAGIGGYSGAAALAGEAALRSGAGLASAVVAPGSLPLMARAPMELMVHGCSAPAEVSFVFERATVLLVGPGLSDNQWADTFFHYAMQSAKPKIIDADGLNWLARHPQKHDNWILTPHPGEAARLLGIATEEVQQNRIHAVKQLQKKYGGVVVLKGAGTLIADNNQNLYLNSGGYPGLATGGTGDVLAGIIAGLVAQNLSLTSAAQLGVCVHTQAAYLEESLGARGMLASDLFLHVRSLLNQYLEHQVPAGNPFGLSD